MVIMKTLSMGIFGLITTVVQIPPRGETHDLPSLPMPPVCCSAMITIPCSADGSFSSAICLPTQLVDVVLSK
jgi:hypothetical protein